MGVRLNLQNLKPRVNLENTAMKTKIVLLLSSILIFGLQTGVKADGIIIPQPPICDPGDCPPTPFPIAQLEIEYHHVEVQIADQIAVTRVDQVFRNPNEWTVEGRYIFPIPPEAVVTDFILWIDGAPIAGEILSAEAARQTYEAIVRDLKDPALLEYSDQGALQAQIFPIEPGQTRRIELEYSQILTAENGLLAYRYPLNTEKFSTQPLESVSVTVEIESGNPIRAAYSPSHPVEIQKPDSYHLRARYAETNIRPETDFLLYYSVGENPACHLLTYRDPFDEINPDGFFLLLLAPEPEAQAEPIPKDILLVLDRSGSMEGEKFIQAQNALRYILTHLNPADRFNIVTFSTKIDPFGDGLQSSEAIPAALAWVDRLAALGSTDINRALLETTDMLPANDPATTARPTYIIFITDGLPTEGVVDSAQILKNFQAEAGPDLRLFSFGVGFDVDTFLLDSLAANHHGRSAYVLPGEQLDETLSGFYNQISSPVLTQLELDFGEIRVTDLYPNPLPDLFEGTQIVIAGRYNQGGSSDITLNGLIHNQTAAFKFQEQFFETDSHASQQNSLNEFIPRLWATRKIGYLLKEIRLNGPHQETIDQIVQLSIRYGIVTPYTSYLVTEPAPLGAQAQNRIAEEQFLALESAAAPAYGRDAVEKAAGQAELETSNFVAAPDETGQTAIRQIGPRTFLLSDGTWTDTAFDPATGETVKINFLSDDYFSLAAAYPELAAAFALGERVIAFAAGTAYEVVAADLAVAPLSISVPAENIPPTLAAETPVETRPETPPQPGPHPTAESPEPLSNLRCFGAGLPLLGLPLIIFSKISRRKP